MNEWREKLVQFKKGYEVAVGRIRNQYFTRWFFVLHKEWLLAVTVNVFCINASGDKNCSVQVLSRENENTSGIEMKLLEVLFRPFVFFAFSLF